MDALYSIRMRSAEGGSHENGGRHISGAERIVTEHELTQIGAGLIDRALHHSKGSADFINICIEKVPNDAIHYIKPLVVSTYETQNLSESHEMAKKILASSVSKIAIDSAFTMLQGLNYNMRGAILMDAMSGERLDETGNKGIRVTRMDTYGPKPSQLFTVQGDMVKVNINMAEALVLASKVQSCTDVVGELCWSDDPDYTVGYVACNGTYHRLRHMKTLGSDMGGRVFFVKTGAHLGEVIQYLESVPVLVKWEC